MSAASEIGLRMPGSFDSSAGDTGDMQLAPEVQDDRPGKFATLDLFLEPYTGACQPIPKVAHTIEFQHGDIIYIQAENKQNQLHSRIMLVTRPRQANMTCLTFCRHDGAVRMPIDHWAVVDDDTSQPRAARNRTEPTIRVKLNNSRKLARNAKIYINLNEPWNVEKDKNSIVGLGCVVDEDFNELRDMAGELYKEGMVPSTLKVEVPSNEEGSKAGDCVTRRREQSSRKGTLESGLIGGRVPERRASQIVVEHGNTSTRKRKTHYHGRSRHHDDVDDR